MLKPSNLKMKIWVGICYKNSRNMLYIWHTEKLCDMNKEIEILKLMDREICPKSDKWHTSLYELLQTYFVGRAN